MKGMKRTRDNDNWLEYRTGFGFLGYWWVIDLLAGAVCCIVALSFTGVDHDATFAVIPGVFFLLRGLHHLSRLRGFTLDRMVDTASVWHAWLRPMFKKSYPLRSYQEVTLNAFGRREGRTTVNYNGVLLGDHRTGLMVWEGRDYIETRRVAEDVAMFLGLPFVDTTGGTVTRTEAADVGKPLNARNEVPVDLAAIPPRNTRLQWTRINERTVIRIPRARLSQFIKTPAAMCLTMFGIAAVMFGIAAVFATAPLTWNEHVKPAILISLGFGTFGMLIGALLGTDALASFEIEAGPKSLQIRRQGLLFRKTQTIRSNEIKEVRNCFVSLEIVTNDKVISIAPEVWGQEREWLRGMLASSLKPSGV